LQLVSGFSFSRLRLALDSLPTAIAVWNDTQLGLVRWVNPFEIVVLAVLSRKMESEACTNLIRYRLSLEASCSRLKIMLAKPSDQNPFCHFFFIFVLLAMLSLKQKIPCQQVPNLLRFLWTLQHVEAKNNITYHLSEQSTPFKMPFLPLFQRRDIYCT